jgi:hypothetical protein
MNGKGKRVFYDTVRRMAQLQIEHPITADDIEVEIVYATDVAKAQRKDTDGVIKPTFDALEGVAYSNDRQVRSVSCTLFDKNCPSTLSGWVEHMSHLFYSGTSHVLLIMIYSDNRLAELGGEKEVQSRRYIQWQRDFDTFLSQLKK